MHADDRLLANIVRQHSSRRSSHISMPSPDVENRIRPGPRGSNAPHESSEREWVGAQPDSNLGDRLSLISSLYVQHRSSTTLTKELCGLPMTKDTCPEISNSRVQLSTSMLYVCYSITALYASSFMEIMWHCCNHALMSKACVAYRSSIEAVQTYFLRWKGAGDHHPPPPPWYRVQPSLALSHCMFVVVSLHLHDAFS